MIVTVFSKIRLPDEWISSDRLLLIGIRRLPMRLPGVFTRELFVLRRIHGNNQLADSGEVGRASPPFDSIECFRSDAGPS